MTTLGQLVARLREALDDPAGGSAHWSDAALQGCISRASGMLYPRVYVAATDTSLTTVAGQAAYALPAGVPSGVGYSAVREVWVETAEALRRTQGNRALDSP